MAKRQKPSGLEPIALALVLCDYVHIDPLTGRYTLLGIYDFIDSAAFPFTHPKMAVYCALRDGRGTRVITFRMIDAEDEQSLLWEDPGEVEFGDPLRLHELAVEVLDVRFEKPGLYRLQLLADDAIIMEYGIQVNAQPDGDPQ